MNWNDHTKKETTGFFDAKTAPLARTTALLLACLSLFILSGCAGMNMGGSEEEPMASAPAVSEPAGQQEYSPPEFNDLLIPSELTWNREKSMVIKTDSFAGGVLNFSGRVKVDDLANYFTITMSRNNWKPIGSVKYKRVLLVFVKPNKTCTITIADSDFGINTEVNIYISEDVTRSGTMGMGMGMDSPSPTSSY